MAFTRLLPAYAPTAHKEVSKVRQYITFTTVPLKWTNRSLN